MGAWHAIYGECLKSKGKNPSKSQKSACYNEATRALGERGGSGSSGKGGAMAKRKSGGSPGSHYKCKYGRLKRRTRGPNGGWRYCKYKPKCAKGARAQAKKVASRRSSPPYQRNKFQGPCRWGRLVSPVKLPGGGMRFCKLKPRDAQASASAAASAPAWMPPDNPADMWANMLGPAPKRRKQIDERRGPFHNIERVHKLRPRPTGWKDLIPKR